MMKKFKFNFSFLDQFKKKQSEIDSPNVILDENLDEILDEIIDETPDIKQNPAKVERPTELLKASQTVQDEESPLLKNSKSKSKIDFNFSKFGSDLNPKKIKIKISDKNLLKPLQKFNWNDFILRLFSPYTRTKVHFLFIILLVATITYMLGKNIALFFNKPTSEETLSTSSTIPFEKEETTGSDIKKIISTNLFNAKENDKSLENVIKKDIDSIVCLDADKPTNLQIKLLDTVVLQDSVKSVASVQMRGSSELTNVREGERLEQMAEVAKINRFKMILKNLETGECEYAATEQETDSAMPDIKIISKRAAKSIFKSLNPDIKNKGNSFKIKKTFRDKMVTDMSDILTQAKAIQIMNPDGSLCFKMTEIVKGSLYSQLNIQDDDIICNINGKKIENLNDLMGLLGKIKEIDQFQIGLNRNGMPENLDYGFE